MGIRVGEKLRNGAMVHALRQEGDKRIVLAHWPRQYGAEGVDHEWVTWRVDEEGNAFWGHYFKTMEGAKHDYDIR